MHKVGLVAKVDCPWAKDSIDFLSFILNEDDEIEMWGIEIKSRQTNERVSKERELIRKLRRKKYEVINAAQAHKYISSVDERYQLIHHAYVYGLDKIAIILGKKDSKVINGTIVQYPAMLLRRYGKVIEELKNSTLQWAYEQDVTIKNVPNNVIQLCNNIPTINGKEAFFTSLKLWKAMFNDTSILPLPTLKRIIPATHAYWNTTKGGSDTITKLVDDCFLNPPRNYTNFESTAVSRCITIQLAAVLRLQQISNAKPNLNFYSSIDHFRNAASHRMSFKKLLRLSYVIFKEEAEKLLGNQSSVLQDIQNSNTHQQRRGQRRVRFQQSVPEPMDFAPEKTFKTPVKAKRRRLEKGKIDDEIAERMHTCTGFPFELVCQEEGGTKKDPRRRCYLCNSKTR